MTMMMRMICLILSSTSMGLADESEDDGDLHSNDDEGEHQDRPPLDLAVGGNLDTITKAIAERVVEMMQKEELSKAKEESSFKTLLSELKETEDGYVCMACVTHSHSSRIPKKLKSITQGKFGLFKKLDSTILVNKERRINIKDHFNSPLHELCENLAKEKEKAQKDHYRKNYEACLKVIKDAIFCFKKSLSAIDFVRLNDKDEMVLQPS